MNPPKDWRARAEALRDELMSEGKLASPELQAAVVNVPRHVFVPSFYERQPGQPWEQVSSTDDRTRERWTQRMYENVSLVTQVGEVAVGSRDQTGPTSSSSAPGLMTRMLEALDLHDGHRVLEIGTGTGYNAGLLCHRLGDANVHSVDIDRDLVEMARSRLAELGYHPTLVSVDGADGLPEHGPYDRIIATCAVSWVPWSWAKQTTADSLILADVKIHATVGNLVPLRRQGDRFEGRFDPGNATFMHMRTPAFDRVPRSGIERDRARAGHRTTTCTVERVWEIPPLWFLVHLGEPGRVDFGYTWDEAANGPGAMFFTSPDGSWCEVSPADGASPRDVWEGGPRRLWAAIESAIDLWHALGQPGWERFGLTVTPGRNVIWVDDPAAEHRWTIPTTDDLHAQ